MSPSNLVNITKSERVSADPLKNRLDYTGTREIDEQQGAGIETKRTQIFPVNLKSFTPSRAGS